MTNEEAEIQVLQSLEKFAEKLQGTGNSLVKDWAAQWAWRFNTDRIRREHIRQKRARRTRAVSQNFGNKNSYYLAPGERFVELAEAFGFSPQSLAELLCEAFARRNPQRLLIDRHEDDEPGGMRLEVGSIPALCCE